MSENILLLKNIVKKFGDKEILQSLDLSVCSGDYISITGRSGSGKSTLLNIISTFDFATFGEYYVNKQLIKIKNASNYANLRNSFFGFIFQMYCLIPKLTTIENICLPTLYSESQCIDLKLLNELMRMLEIDGLKDKCIDYLSGGEKQRIAIARAMINKPSCLICDEPTGNLDDKSAQIIIEFFENMNSNYNLTILLVTHNLKFAKNAKKGFVLEHGKLSQ